jgi:hypothetical protein
MGRFNDKLASIAATSRFSQIELEQMFASEEDRAALTQVTDALRKQTNDLTAMNELIEKGSAVVGVVMKVARKALG